MRRSAPQIHVTVHGDIHCVRLCKQRLNEEDLNQAFAEMSTLVDDKGCHKLVISFGPGELSALYSVFLAKLVSLQKKLNQKGGQLKLAHVSKQAKEVFRVCNLDALFEFYADQAKALASFAED